LRRIPGDVWRRARAKAMLEGTTVREVIIELLDRWATFEGGRFVDQPKRRKRKT